MEKVTSKKNKKTKQKQKQKQKKSLFTLFCSYFYLCIMYICDVGNFVSFSSFHVSNLFTGEMFVMQILCASVDVDSVIFSRQQH